MGPMQISFREVRRIRKDHRSSASPSKGDCAKKHAASYVDTPARDQYYIEVSSLCGRHSPLDDRGPILRKVDGAESIARSILAPGRDMSKLGINRWTGRSESNLQMNVISASQISKEWTLPLAWCGAYDKNT
jgi:hypothetical protein